MQSCIVLAFSPQSFIVLVTVSLSILVLPFRTVSVSRSQTNLFLKTRRNFEPFFRICIVFLTSLSKSRCDVQASAVGLSWCWASSAFGCFGISGTSRQIQVFALKPVALNLREHRWNHDPKQNSKNKNYENKNKTGIKSQSNSKSMSESTKNNVNNSIITIVRRIFSRRRRLIISLIFLLLVVLRLPL